MSWQAEFDAAAGFSAVWPLEDLRPHDPFSEACWCRPTWDERVLVHNSADGREEYERGRKPS
ncbi:MAG TPA: hypothetical protein VMV33_17220 [Rhodocyclaceae bacterium]|nr:hypothetical protein [Rhodocyclaceae bacterium]